MGAVIRKVLQSGAENSISSGNARDLRVIVFVFLPPCHYNSARFYTVLLELDLPSI